MDALASLPDATVLLLPEQVEPFRHDESHLVGPAPLAVAKPRSARALRELVRLAKAEGFGLVARGAGTGKAGGCVPMARTVVVGMEDFPGTVRISRSTAGSQNSKAEGR